VGEPVERGIYGASVLLTAYTFKIARKGSSRIRTLPSSSQETPRARWMYLAMSVRTYVITPYIRLFWEARFAATGRVEYMVYCGPSLSLLEGSGIAALRAREISVLSFSRILTSWRQKNSGHWRSFKSPRMIHFEVPRFPMGGETREK